MGIYSMTHMVIYSMTHTGIDSMKHMGIASMTHMGKDKDAYWHSLYDTYRQIKCDANRYRIYEK